jgi:4-amino-4-deoxy-L-arabinose transferase-like glycosyltransferase
MGPVEGEQRFPPAWTWLLTLAAVRLLLHSLTNGQYGFHRDELATLADARHLDWGFPAYPPLTPFVARVAMGVLGESPTTVRFFTALAQTTGMVFTGLMAREFGGNRQAQITAALAAFAAPVSVAAGHLFQYVSFDYLWCVLTAYFVVRLLRTEDPRWWLAVGTTIGLGFLTRYTIAWLVAGLLAGFLLTPARRLLASRWFAAAIGLVILIVLPSLMWHVRHNFLALEFTSTIHARDIRIGRADGFLWKQFLVPASMLTIPLWIGGLVWLFRSRWRPIAWTFVIAVALFAAARARDYYSAPLYPMLLAAGAVAMCRWPTGARKAQWRAIGIGIVISITLILPVSPVNSTLFKISTKISGDPVEEIGWPELTAAVAKVYDDLPETDRPRAGIFAGNYGEAGALALFGPAHNLPEPISRANSFWMRGYPDPPPETLVVLGVSNAFAAAHFASCETKMTFNSPFGVDNEENGGLIRVCRGLKEPWPEFWRKVRIWT